MYVKGGQVPSEFLSLYTTNANTCTMDYQTLFSGFGIHNGNTDIQITPTQSMKRSFMIIIDLMPDGCASEVTPVSPATAKFAANSNSTKLSPK
jgi:hypothetical protein